MDSPGGGVDLSECDRVHLPVGYSGVSRKEKLEGEKGGNYFCGRREERTGKESG